jgi:hypothetical protein
MARNIRKQSRTNNRLIVVVPNISHNHLKDGVAMGGLGDYLSEVGTNVQKMLDVEVILVTSADKGTVRV